MAEDAPPPAATLALPRPTHPAERAIPTRPPPAVTGPRRPCMYWLRLVTLSAIAVVLLTLLYYLFR